MKLRVFLTSIGVYVIALFLPGLTASGPNPYGFTGYNGFGCLVWGATTILGNRTYFLPWTANLVYLAAIIAWGAQARPPRWGAVFPLVAIALAATVWRIDSVIVNEAGHHAAVRPGAGAYLWIASMAILLGGFLKGVPSDSEG